MKHIKLYFICIFFLAKINIYPQVVVTDSNNEFASSFYSILDIQSSNKGILLPRITNKSMIILGEKLTKRESGMIVYCTNSKPSGIYTYDFENKRWNHLIDSKILSTNIDTTTTEFDNKIPTTSAIKPYINNQIIVHKIALDKQTTLSDLLKNGFDAEGASIRDVGWPIADNDGVTREYVDTRLLNADYLDVNKYYNKKSTNQIFDKHVNINNIVSTINNTQMEHESPKNKYTIPTIGAIVESIDNVQTFTINTDDNFKQNDRYPISPLDDSSVLLLTNSKPNNLSLITIGKSAFVTPVYISNNKAKTTDEAFKYNIPRFDVLYPNKKSLKLTTDVFIVNANINILNSANLTASGKSIFSNNLTAENAIFNSNATFNDTLQILGYLEVNGATDFKLKADIVDSLIVSGVSIINSPTTIHKNLIVNEKVNITGDLRISKNKTFIAQSVILNNNTNFLNITVPDAINARTVTSSNLSVDKSIYINEDLKIKNNLLVTNLTTAKDVNISNIMTIESNANLNDGAIINADLKVKNVSNINILEVTDKLQCYSNTTTFTNGLTIPDSHNNESNNFEVKGTSELNTLCIEDDVDFSQPVIFHNNINVLSGASFNKTENGNTLINNNLTVNTVFSTKSELKNNTNIKKELTAHGLVTFYNTTHWDNLTVSDLTITSTNNFINKFEPSEKSIFHKTVSAENFTINDNIDIIGNKGLFKTTTTTFANFSSALNSTYIKTENEHKVKIEYISNSNSSRNNPSIFKLNSCTFEKELIFSNKTPSTINNTIDYLNKQPFTDGNDEHCIIFSNSGTLIGKLPVGVEKSNLINNHNDLQVVNELKVGGKVFINHFKLLNDDKYTSNPPRLNKISMESTPLMNNGQIESSSITFTGSEPEKTIFKVSYLKTYNIKVPKIGEYVSVYVYVDSPESIFTLEKHLTETSAKIIAVRKKNTHQEIYLSTTQYNKVEKFIESEKYYRFPTSLYSSSVNLESDKNYQPNGRYATSIFNVQDPTILRIKLSDLLFYKEDDKKNITLEFWKLDNNNKKTNQWSIVANLKKIEKRTSKNMGENLEHYFKLSPEQIEEHDSKLNSDYTKYVKAYGNFTVKIKSIECKRGDVILNSKYLQKLFISNISSDLSKKDKETILYINDNQNNNSYRTHKTVVLDSTYVHSIYNNNGKYINRNLVFKIDGSLKVAKHVNVGKILIASDIRLKNILKTTNNSNSLSKINKIEIVDYFKKDIVTLGVNFEKKVIAQQLEQIYPQSVKQCSEFIPNIYDIAKSYTETKDKVTINIKNDIKVNDQVRIIYEEYKGDDKKVGELTVIAQVIEANNNSFSIKQSNRYIRKFNNSQISIFVYGVKVDDFRVVDYDAIGMLNVSATQELDSLIKLQQEKQKHIKTKLEKYNFLLDRLIKEHTQIKSKLDNIQSKLPENKTNLRVSK